MNDNKTDIDSLYIIDAHSHIGRFAAVSISHCDADDLIVEMDSIGLKKICISSLIGMSGDYHFGNNMVSDAVKRYPDRIIGMACINPYKKDSIENELCRCFDSLGMSLIKIHPIFSACPMNSDNYIPVYEFASERKLTILNHSWGNHRILDRLSNKYPDINFIQAHTAGGWDGKNGNKFLELAKINDNVYVDIAYSISYYGAFEKLVKYVGAEKIIYGSDYPMMNMAYQLGRVLFSDIGSENKQKILCGNIRRIVKII